SPHPISTLFPYTTLFRSIKDALYTIFPELPSITSNSPPSEIRQWKSNPIVASCHNKLFKKIVVEEPTTFMSKILDCLFPSKKARSEEHTSELQSPYDLVC